MWELPNEAAAYTIFFYASSLDMHAPLALRALLILGACLESTGSGRKFGKKLVGILNRGI